MKNNTSLKKCAICGNYFKPNLGARFCSKECREQYKKVYSSEYRKKPKVEKKERNKENNLVELAKAARENGMSYGQYMAKEYAKKNPIIREW